MADFTAFNASAAKLTATANAVAAYVPTLSDASVQTNIDAGTAAMDGAEATLATLLPPETAPVAEEPTS